MRVVEDLSEEEGDEVAALVITGEGRTEFRRLGYIAEDFDDDDILHFPLRPERRLQIRGRQRAPSHTQQHGFSALEAIRTFKSKYGYRTFLFIVDKEHVAETGFTNLRGALETKLSEIATGEVDIDELRQSAFYARLDVGATEIEVLTAIIGDEFECFEDGMAKLLEMEWGAEISPESRSELKSEIQEILSGGQESSLLENANRYSIEESFPSLSEVLTRFE